MLVSQPPIVVDVGVVGLELDRFVEVGERQLIFAHAVISTAAIVVERRIVGVELDRLVVQSDRPLILPRIEKFIAIVDLLCRRNQTLGLVGINVGCRDRHRYQTADHQRSKHQPPKFFSIEHR